MKLAEPKSPITPWERKIYVISILLVPVAVYLMNYHTLFTLLTIPFCFGTTLGLASIISRVYFERTFTPVSKYDDWRKFSWIDKLLTWSAIGVGIVLLFYLGEVADCVREEDVWKSVFIKIGVEMCELIRQASQVFH